MGRDECSVKCEVWRKQWEVRSVKCGVWSFSLECEERSVKCEVWGLECEGSSEQWEVWSVDCEVWSEVWSVKFQFGVGRKQWKVRSVKCGLWSVECEVRSEKCEVWSVKDAVRGEKCEVRSVKCGLWSVECEVRSEKCEVWSVKEAVRSEKCEVRSVKCGLWSVECEVRSEKCEVWSVRFGVWRKQWEVRSVKCGVWSVKCEVRSVDCEVWSVDCEVWSVKEAVGSEKCEVWSVKFQFGVRRAQCTGCLWTIGHLCLGNFRRRLARVYVIILSHWRVIENFQPVPFSSSWGCHFFTSYNHLSDVPNKETESNPLFSLNIPLKLPMSIPRLKKKRLTSGNPLPNPCVPLCSCVFQTPSLIFGTYKSIPPKWSSCCPYIPIKANSPNRHQKWPRHHLFPSESKIVSLGTRFRPSFDRRFDT